MNLRQKKFCIEYLKDLNATKSALRAGYSAKTSSRIGSENLKKLEIKNEIERMQQSEAKRAGLVVEDVVNAIRAVAFDDEAKTSDKLKALEMLAKYLGMFKEGEQKATVINVINRIKEIR